MRSDTVTEVLLPVGHPCDVCIGAAVVSGDTSCADLPLIPSHRKSTGLCLRWEYETEEL